MTQEELDDLVYALVGGFAIVLGIVVVFMLAGFLGMGVESLIRTITGN